MGGQQQQRGDVQLRRFLPNDKDASAAKDKEQPVSCDLQAFTAFSHSLLRLIMFTLTLLNVCDCLQLSFQQFNASDR